jgi:hypothetical protein
MSVLDWTYVFLGVEPLGGILASVPFGLLVLQYPVWLVLVTSPLLAYVQVVVVDVAWTGLERMAWWRGFLDRRRSPRVERLLAGRGAFWSTFAAAPLVGPWAVMAFMRYARVPQRRVALPILLSMTAVSLVTTALCLLVPALFATAAS